VRAGLLLLWLVVAAVVVSSLLRRLAGPTRRARPAPPDELVKDPVCQTYVVRSKAVTRSIGGVPAYFCSDECARRAGRA
jgi:hypothetical protein